MEPIKQLIELFPYAVLGSILAGIICGFLGVFVISQRVVFLGAVLTQVSIAGVAFSFLHILNLESFISSITGMQAGENSFMHNFEPAFYSLLFACFTVFLFSQSFRQKLITQDVLLGIIFIVSVALRIMFIQKSPAAEISEIDSILKGDILFIGEEEFYALGIILIIVLAIFLLFSKQFKFVSFDAETANAHGLKAGFWMLFFYLIIGMGISITTRYVGDVFVFAYLIIPSLTGLLFARRIITVFIIAAVFGALLPPVSLYLAFILDYSSGPAAVITASILFITLYLYKRIIH